MCEHTRDVSLGFTNEKFPQGVHICYFYNNEEERREVISQFLASGLEGGEQIGYFSRQLPATDLLDNLENLGVDVSCEQNKGHFNISSTEQTYYPDGYFDPEKMIGNIHEFYADSMEKGFSGARASGEMQWASQDIPGTDRLFEYETKVNIALKKSPVTAICQYNTNLFDGTTIMELLRVHPLVVTNGQIMHNPFFSLPEGMDL